MDVMSTKTRDDLKKAFGENSVPTGADFADLIDTAVNKTDDKTATLEVTTVKATTVEAGAVTASKGLTVSYADTTTTTKEALTVDATGLVTAKTGLTIATNQSLTLGGVAATKIVGTMAADESDDSAIPTCKAVRNRETLEWKYLPTTWDSFDNMIIMYAKDRAGIVHLRGVLHWVGGAPELMGRFHIATLPNGFQPEYPVIAPIVSSDSVDGISPTFLEIWPDGKILTPNWSSQFGMKFLSDTTFATAPPHSLLLHVPFDGSANDTSKYQRTVGDSTLIGFDSDSKFTKCCRIGTRSHSVNMRWYGPYLGAQFTISVWIKLSRLDPYLYREESHSGDPNPRRSIEVGNLGIDKLGKIINQDLDASAIGAWSHILLTRNADARELKYYINNNLVLTREVGTPSFSHDYFVKLFKCWNSPFDVRMAQLRVYNRVLSADEIKKLYDTPDIDLPEPT